MTEAEKIAARCVGMAVGKGGVGKGSAGASRWNANGGTGTPDHDEQIGRAAVAYMRFAGLELRQSNKPPPLHVDF